MSIDTTESLSPLGPLQRDAGAEHLAYGPSPDQAVPVVETFGVYEAEYAVLRKGVGILHRPWRGLLRFTGADRADFLHRLLTQDVRGMTGGMTRRTLLLNEKGRIVTDALIHHGDIDTWLELDRFDIAATRALLDKRLFSEDVVIEDVSEQRVAVALHGPAALTLVQAIEDASLHAGDSGGTSTAERMAAMPGTHHVIALRGGDGAAAQVTAYRRDECDAPGVHLWISAAAASAVYANLAAAVGGLSPDVDQSDPPRDAAGPRGPKRAIKGRGIGWLAYNTARVEAGHAIYHIDFGPDTLPHEAGPRVMEECVSFTKGCYLGQEIVARMQNLGHPKKVLVSLKFEDDRLPISGSAVLAVVGGQVQPNEVIGGITSAAVSPMRGQKAVALAMMKWGQHTRGAIVAAPAEGGWTIGVVQ